MRPEYPPWFTPLRVFIDHYCYSEHDNDEVCDMLRLGELCGNDGRNVLVGDRGDGQGYIGMAICDACRQEVHLSDEETTAYWREKQREWGVR